MTDPSLLKQQIDMELDAIDARRQAWMNTAAQAKEDEAEADTGYGQRTIKNTITATAEVVRTKLAEMFAGKPGRPSAAAGVLKGVDPSVAAYIALRAVVDGISSPRDLTAVARDAGHRLEDQQKLAQFNAQYPELFKLTTSRLDRQAVFDRNRRRVVMKLMANRTGMDWQAWNEKLHVQVGLFLIECIKEASGLIETPLDASTVRGRHRNRLLIIPAADTSEFLLREADRLSLLSPQYQPMIVRPKRWTNPHNGGYWSGFLLLPLIKQARGKVMDELANRDSREIYSAVNRMQETPWRVNARVLEVLDYAIEKGMGIAGLPPMSDAEVPAKPVDIATNVEARREWKKKASSVHSSNQKIKSKRVQVIRTAEIARRFQKYEAIYFPHQLDFRGRAYAVPMFLNPQSADYSKALLTFAEGKPINDGVAAGWLAIHGANSFGVDKVTFEARIDWVTANEDAILATAADPWSNEAFWTAADKPWQFLAFCFEWAAFQAEGYGYVSSLPVALDGSCNGLQHYSAALRDEIGACATNLCPATTPHDIYAEVAREAQSTVAPLVVAGSDPGSSAWFAAKWIEFGIDRKVAKRSVMTLPYGSTIFSTREFIELAINDKLAHGAANPFAYRKMVEKGDGSIDYADTTGIFDASLFLQGHMWNAIGRVVHSAVEAMGWLRSAAKLAAEEGLPAIWSLPDGFMVYQGYPETKSRQIKTIFEGRILKPSLSHEIAGKLDSRRMTNGIAPNFVHSLDAYALRAYVNLAADNGIRSFGTVHDSFSTVAADVELMSACIRESFATMYEENDVLRQFYEAIKAMLSDKRRLKLKPPPAAGEFDISQVRQSDFFFA